MNPKVGVLLAGIVFVFCGAVGAQQEPAGEGRPITPAGSLVLDAATKLPAVGAMPMAFRRSPDTLGPDAKGRYLLVMFSGFGVQFDSETNRAQQSVGVIDLNAQPEPALIQSVYFPTPQSANVGIAFSASAKADGSYDLYVSGGYENKIWIFRFNPKKARPIEPGSPGPDTKVAAPFIELGNSSDQTEKEYNGGKAALYPAGIALTGDGNTLVTANNLGDSTTVIRGLRGKHAMNRVDLHHAGRPAQNIYPYDVVIVGSGSGAKAFVSCWNDASVAVVSLGEKPTLRKHITVDRHPTAMLLNARATRLYVVNSNADNVSVIDTRTEREVERIDVRLAETALLGASPEGLALSEDEKTLYVANAHGNAVAVVALSNAASDMRSGKSEKQTAKSSVRGFIPTGQYPSAVSIAGGKLYVGNGKGTGFENSSLRVNNSGRTPNAPNEAFPPNAEKHRQGGQYDVSLISGTISLMALPDDPALARYTQQAMQNDGLLGMRPTKLFSGASPIKHVIYIIKENRTYDQVFGDVKTAGNGQPADGDDRLAIFGGGAAARRPDGTAQNITPNHHALTQRFGLLDRFFVNSEASPDGHNWSTAAFSTDYVDKGFRWEYSGRGRTYDWEGYNRLPDYEPPSEMVLEGMNKSTLDAMTETLEKHIPYKQGSVDLAEPKTLYLWDAAERAGVSHKNYGEYVTVISERDVAAAKAKKDKTYPDISPAQRAIPTKKSLEGHHSESFRSFDLTAPDSFSVECYKLAQERGAGFDPAVTRENPAAECRGNSRLGEWLADFQKAVAEREAGRGDTLPALTVMRFPNDHTNGIKRGYPTPQFFVAENDYAVGRLAEAVSSSAYWKDTAIFVVEDDAQAGPDHVDSHRSVGMVVSAYNKPGALIHTFHNTVSMIRTMEALLGIPPMNQLDASAIPMDIFQDEPDLRPYKAVLPAVAADNWLTTQPKTEEEAKWMKKSNRQNFRHADLADPAVLNAVIWFACTGQSDGMPAAGQLPAYHTMLLGVTKAEEVEGVGVRKDDDD